MKILLTGAAGQSASPFFTPLESGHDVTAGVRSDASAEKVPASGAAAVVGDLTDSDPVS